MFRSLLLGAGLALLVAGCSGDSPTASDENAGAVPASKLIVSGSRAGGGRRPAESRPGTPVSALTRQYELRFDQVLDADGLEVTWQEVNDSRCPEGGVCVWEGEVGVLLGVRRDGQDLGAVSLTLRHPGDERAQARIAGRLIQLVEVTPHPVLDQETTRAEYLALVAVTPALEARPLPGSLTDSEYAAGGYSGEKPRPEPGDIDQEPGEKPDYAALKASLAENRTKWETAGAQRYRFRFQRSCFCLPDFTRPVYLTVGGGSVEAAEFADTGEAVEPANLGRYETVEALFDLIVGAIEGEAARIDAEFDAELGYPVRLYIDRNLMMADEEQGFEARELVILE